MNHEKNKGGLEALAGEEVPPLSSPVNRFAGLEVLAGEEVPLLPAKASMPLS